MQRSEAAVVLHASVPETLRELDFLRFCAGFEGIEIGVAASGSWAVWHPGAPPEDLRLDLDRLVVVLALVRFDGEGNVVRLPARAEMEQALRHAGPPPEVPRATPPPKPGLVAWDRAKARPSALVEPAERQRLTFAEVAASPCGRCAAPCCRVLVFDHRVPDGADPVDSMERLLRMPGLELALTSHGWKILVNSTCRFFDVERAGCTIWGRPERPLICSRYDAHACAYRTWLIEPQSTPFVRVDHDTFQRVRRHFPTDDGGRVTADLTPDHLRAILSVVAPDRLPPAVWGTQ